MRENMEQLIEREASQSSLPVEASLQVTRSEKKESQSKWRRLKRHFFTEDVSPDNYSIIDLQWRASWLGVALILQAINEIDPKYYLPFLPFLRPWAGVISFLLILGSLVAMWRGLRTKKLKQPARRSRDSFLYHARPHRWQRVILVCLLGASLVGVIQFGRSIVLSFFLPPQYTNDGTSLDINAAALLLQGRNPYTDSDIVHLVRQYPIEPNWTTPLRVGQFANRLDYPSYTELSSVLDTDLKAGHAPEFESKVSYPPLSFLTLVPFVWLNIFNVLPFYLLCYLVLLVIAWKVVRPELRPWVVLLWLANVSMWSSVVGGNLDIFNILLIVLSWLLRERRWWSALLLGLALATKQLTWFFIPFYMIMVWRQYNFMEVVRRLAIAGGVALAINLPFILWNPHAWLAGIMAPIADPMFPLGVGIIGLSFTPLLPILPSWVYTVLEIGAIPLVMLWYWHLCKERPEAAMLLAVIPLFFAWRSLPSYFGCSAYPLLMFLAAKTFAGKSKQSRQVVDQPVRLPLDHDEPVIRGTTTPADAQAALQGIYYFRTWATAKLASLLPGLSSMR
jgi:Glycosyltransferase family 87